MASSAPASNGVPAVGSSSTTEGMAQDGGSDAEGQQQEEDKIIRKTLFYLVSTLNAAFYPDYDFSTATSREFSKEHSLKHVMSAVEQQLYLVSCSQLLPLSQQLWTAIDEAIDLQDCEIYTYNPDEESDPYSDDGCLWSFNYFFYNPRLKRIVFFSCRLVSAKGSDSAQASSDYYMDSDIDFDD